MKTVKLTEVLDYYDGIQIFAAQDPAGELYICEMIDDVGDFDRYAVAGVRPDRLDDFRAGRVDLLTLLLEAPGGQWYTTIADGAIDDPLTLEPQACPIQASDYLPDPGFLLRFDAHDAQETPTVFISHGNPTAVAISCLSEITNRIIKDMESPTDAGINFGGISPDPSIYWWLPSRRRYCFHCAEIREVYDLWQYPTLYSSSSENRQATSHRING